MQGEAHWRGLFQTKLHPRCSVVSVPIRVLFQLLGQSLSAHNANSNGNPIDHQPLAIGYDQPSAVQGEARLYELWRIMYLKTSMATRSSASRPDARHTSVRSASVHHVQVPSCRRRRTEE